MLSIQIRQDTSRCGKSLHSDRPPGSTWTTRLLHSPGRVTVPPGKPPETTTRISDTNFNLSTGFQIQFTLSDLIGFVFFFSGARPRPLVPPKLPPVQLFAVLWFAMNFQAQVFPPPNETVNEVELKQNKKKEEKKVAAARREKSPPE